jgi:succinate-semialdehyde dehydrogenase/glutarate-semialdehyde dehydrogenase
VLRPSSQTPGVAMVMVDGLRAEGLPDGAVNLVVGSTGATYTPIMADSRVRKVSLTGSTRVGQQMIRDAADTVKKVSMELGGNAPLIIHDDADLEGALDLTVPTKFANCGQVCVTPDRIFVHDSLRDAFVDGFVARTAQIKLGDGLDPGTGMGLLINGGRMAVGLKAGMVGINSFALAAADAPFGGTNHSGMSREGGIEGISDYPDTKLAQIVFRGAQCSSTG